VRRAIALLLTVCAQCLTTSAYGQNGIAAADTAQLSKGRLWLSAPVATLFGLSGAVAGILAGYRIFDCSDEGSSCARGPDNAEGLGAAAGLFPGASLGAHLGGLRADSRGDMGTTMLAALAGSVAFTAAQLNYDGTGDDPASVISLLATPLAAAIVNTQVRKPRGQRPQGRTLPGGQFQVVPPGGRARIGAVVHVSF
jgi:hypothetical protein